MRHMLLLLLSVMYASCKLLSTRPMPLLVFFAGMPVLVLVLVQLLIVLFTAVLSVVIRVWG